MPEKKMNWGTLVIGIVIGAIAMWAIGAATKPAVGQVGQPDRACIEDAVSRPFTVGQPCFSVQGDIIACTTAIADNVVGCTSPRL